MADYVLPSAVEKRVRFFDGQFLQDQDFIDEQKYQLDREHRHSRLLHGSGIADGLVVSTAALNQVTVAPGTAIDADGNQLVLAQATVVDLPAANFNDKQSVQIYISFLATAEDQQTVGGSSDFTRWLERPQLTALAPGDSYSGTASPVLLASVGLDHAGHVTVDNSVRTYAGLLLPGPGSDPAALRATSSGGVHLAGALTVDGNLGVGTAAPAYPLQLAVGKALRVEGGSSAADSAAYFSFGGNGAFSIDAPGVPSGRFVVQNSGNVGVGTANPGAKLEVAGGGGGSVDLVVNGRLRSDNNDGGLWVSHDRFVGGFETDKIGFWSNNDWRVAVLPNGNVGIGTHNPGARLEVFGGGGDSVDLVVNGRLRSNSNDGGLWVTQDRFFGGYGNGQMGLWNNGDWRLTVLPNGNVGIGNFTPAYPLHVPAGKALRVEGGSSATDSAAYFSFGGNGAFSIDAPGVPSGRFLVQNSGNVGVGTANPGAKLTVSSNDAHMQLRSESSAPAGTKIFLELFQDNSPAAVYPCLRFHHSNVFWHRIQGQPEGLSFRSGNPGDNSLINVFANTAVLNQLQIGNVTIGANELAILQKLAAGTLQFDLWNVYQNEYAYAADYSPFDGSRRYVFTWRTKGERVNQGRWQASFPS